MEGYPADIEAAMQAFYQSLSEKERRRYAAIEARKIGSGGISYIARLLGCSRQTVRRGIQDLDHLPEDPAGSRQRRPGGGRKPFDVTHPGIDEQFLDVVQEHTAGDPTDEDVRWTNLTQDEISRHLAEAHGTKVSRKVIGQLLRRHGYKLRKAQKTKTMKQARHRDEQFQKITRLKADYQKRGLPVISIDTKKKELLGPFYREGRLYAQQPVEVYDHDFPSFSEGVVIPHGIYDLTRNTAFVNLGTSRDTSAFVCDSVRQWWREQGRLDWPEAQEMLVLCDGGGSHSSRNYIVKQDLQELAEELGLRLRVAHYPPYCSKYNPIEHRLFPHLSRACRGVVFKSLEMVKALMEQAKTRTGLRVQARLLEKVYETGRKVAADFKQTMRILFDEDLPAWNYVVLPHSLPCST